MINQERKLTMKQITKTMNPILQRRIEEAEEEIALSVFNATSEETEWITDACIESVKQGANFALQNQWISVDEALPPRSHFLDGEESVKSIDVFVRYKNGAVTSAWYSYCTKVWYFAVGRKGDNSIHGEITHWMPIPQLEGGEECK